SKAFEEISENDSFIIFLQVFYPQDIPEMDGSRGAYLGCITQFSSFLEAKRKVEQKAGLKAWGSCVKRQDNAPAIQVDLAKCLAQLKTE
ncbi:MAG: hypothetical protein H7333_03505, partial [Bdellovibrionales bacterium]|nr:hypothetical protein [Oligoflexia bacterium]